LKYNSSNKTEKIKYENGATFWRTLYTTDPASYMLFIKQNNWCNRS